MAVFDQLLGTAQSKTAGTSLVISPVSKTVTVGKTIFVAFACDDVGSAFGITDNLGNTYTQVEDARNVGAIKSSLWAAPVTVGGSITTITISWTTDVTAKAAVAGEYSSFGAFRVAGGDQTGSNTVIQTPNNLSFFDGELWIGAHGVEDNIAPTVSGTSGTPAQTPVVAGSIGTSGGGSASNIAVALVHFLIAGDSTANATLQSTLDGTQERAGCSRIYNAASTGTLEWLGQSPLPRQRSDVHLGYALTAHP